MKNRILGALERGENFLAHIGGAVLQPLVLLLFRITWGWQLALAGLGKLQNHSRTVEFFSGLGIPAPELNAWFVGGAELVGGSLLLLGLLSRPAALLVAGNMIVAYLSVPNDRAAVFNVFSDVEPFVTAAPFFFLLTATLILAFGPGLIALDTLRTRKQKPS